MIYRHTRLENNSDGRVDLAIRECVLLVPNLFFPGLVLRLAARNSAL